MAARSRVVDSPSLSPLLFFSRSPSLRPSLSLSLTCTRIAANDEARIDKRDPTASVDSHNERGGDLEFRRPVTGNRSCRPHWPARSSEKPRPACLQRRSRKTGTSGCSHYARRCPALHTSVAALSRYRGNVFRPVRVHYRHAGRFTTLPPSRGRD